MTEPTPFEAIFAQVQAARDELRERVVATLTGQVADGVPVTSGTIGALMDAHRDEIAAWLEQQATDE